MSTTTTRAKESPARRRILDTALRLFYAEGIHTVGIDRIIAEAGVAKATFYHHFPAKDDLVCAYLAEQVSVQQAAAARIRAAVPTPIEAVHLLFQELADVGCTPDFRGCGLLNAAAEYPDPEHPVRRVVAEHRRWFTGLMRELLVEAGRPAPDETAALLLAVRDGVVIGADLDDPAETRTRTHAHVARILAS